MANVLAVIVHLNKSRCKSLIFTHNLLVMKNLYLILAYFAIVQFSVAQTNIHFSNQIAANVLDGNYNPGDYEGIVNVTPQKTSRLIEQNINADSLRSYLERMSQFETRNSGSDTLSVSTGIGAARIWALSRFTRISEENNNRLVVSYLNWEREICGMDKHKNIVAILPGSAVDAANTPAGIVIIEAHFDSRCATSCDVECAAHGMEDNGSGSTLVLELARVMSKYQFDRTILFMLTTAEEQGLNGAIAMADYCVDNDVELAAVLNNDVIGGVICGATSSEPSCPTENDVDSIQVRLFSSGTIFSQNKQLARYIKLQYDQELRGLVTVPMQVTIMSAEDRTGRGSDHIPFRQRGFAAMRFTSANEHGNANTADANYHDRQHTSDDVLGEDTNNDGEFDNWFVDFNYLARNAAINGNAANMIAQNVCQPDRITMAQTDWKTLKVTLSEPSCEYSEIAIALRTETNDWDTVIYSSTLETSFDVALGFTYFVSAAFVNEMGVESLFSEEQYQDVVGLDEPNMVKTGIELLQNRPNPFDETTSIAFIAHEMPVNAEAIVRIQDINGAVIYEQKTPIRLGANEVIYDHGYGRTGTYMYSLVIDNQVVDSKKMVFVAN